MTLKRYFRVLNVVNVACPYSNPFDIITPKICILNNCVQVVDRQVDGYVFDLLGCAIGGQSTVRSGDECLCAVAKYS